MKSFFIQQKELLQKGGQDPRHLLYHLVNQGPLADRLIEASRMLIRRLLEWKLLERMKAL